MHRVKYVVRVLLIVIVIMFCLDCLIGFAHLFDMPETAYWVLFALVTLVSLFGIVFPGAEKVLSYPAGEFRRIIDICRREKAAALAVKPLLSELTISSKECLRNSLNLIEGLSRSIREAPSLYDQ